MDLTKYEKIVLILLSVMLLTGSVILRAGQARPYRRITVGRGAVTEELTLKQVEELLKEERKIAVNTASESDLENIPGVGKALAARIAGYRSVHGRFYSEKDLLKVKGIGEKKLAKMREWIRFQ